MNAEKVNPQDVVVRKSFAPSPGYNFLVSPMDERRTVWTETEAGALLIARKMAKASKGKVICRGTVKGGAS